MKIRFYRFNQPTGYAVAQVMTPQGIRKAVAKAEVWPDVAFDTVTNMERMTTSVNQKVRTLRNLLDEPGSNS